MGLRLVLNNHLRRRWRRGARGDAAHNGGVPWVSGRPNGEDYGENCAIHEGDDGEVETERSLFRRGLRSGGLCKEPTARVLARTRPLRTTIVGGNSIIILLRLQT